MTQVLQEINMVAMGERAKEAAFQLAAATTEQKNDALLAIADALDTRSPDIFEANRIDIEQALANGTDPVWVRDRINLERRMAGIISDVRKVAELPDPVGRLYDQRQMESGISVSRKRVPFGVLGVIYESRPNVTVDISTLALKTGNAVILRGGSDVLNTNLIVVEVLVEALASVGLPTDAIQYIASTDRKYVSEMLKLDQYVDMIIPRGGAGLHKFARENSTIPVITGGIGVCHLFVDDTAKLDAALPVINNAKTQRPAVCNTIDTLLVHEAIASEFLPQVVADLEAADVVFKADETAQAILSGNQRVSPVEDADYHTEWMGLTLNLKIVSGLDEAIDHIRAIGTNHSDGILTEDPANAETFLNRVDSSAVFWNASTRFNDGSALGLGAEVAVSTQKMHARGPMALEELTTYKWVVKGDYTPRL